MYLWTVCEFHLTTEIELRRTVGTKFQFSSTVSCVQELQPYISEALMLFSALQVLVKKTHTVYPQTTALICLVQTT